jgi:phenolic acid decarboxylase
MKKILFLFAMLFMFAGYVSSQTVLYEDNLDSYSLNSFLAVDNPTWWTTWSNAPGGGEDIQIRNNFASSTPMSGSADKTGGQTDAILKLGNKVSGAYELKWKMYIETGKCGYYNIQHMQSPGIEWAFEIYFRADGTLELQCAGNTVAGSYIKDQWFEVKHEIDLDKDSISLFIDGILLNKWKFSDQASAAGGTLQLGGVDLFAGEYSGSGETPGFYVDDFYFAETATAVVPVITVNPTSVSKWLVDATNGTDSVIVTNAGTAALTFDANIVYNYTKKKNAPVTMGTGNTVSVKRSLTNAALDPTPTPGGAAPATDASAQLHYDADNASAVGWNSPPITVTVAARFPNSMTLPYAGMDLTAVEVFVNDLNASGNLMKVKIFGMGNTYEPGTLLYEQSFTPIGASWETITLTTPVKITGEDLWVGYQFTQTDASIYIAGTDGGPADPNGDFLSTGVGWSHLSSSIDANWNIRADLEGTVAPHWLTCAPMSGNVAAGDDQKLTLNFTTTGLTLGSYHAVVKLLSNDLTNPVLDVPVTLTVVGVGINELEKIGVMVYPNPVTDVLNIKTDGTIRNITVTDLSGKIVYKGIDQSISISSLSNGVYFVKVETAQGVANTKFIKK